jgi:hypothetical protein
MPTVFEDLVKVMKIEPKSGEDFETFAKRLTDKINGATDTVWKQLSDDAQKWHNEAILKVRERRALKNEGKQEEAEAVVIPELEGFALVSTAEADPAAAPKRTSPNKAKSDTVAAPAAEAVTESAHVKHRKAVKEARAKHVAKAPKAKAKPAKAAPKAKAKAGKRGRRSVFGDDAKLKLLVKENPYRKGTAWHRRWPKYKNGMTVAEALKLNDVGRNHLRYSVANGHISIG